MAVWICLVLYRTGHKAPIPELGIVILLLPRFQENPNADQHSTKFGMCKHMPWCTLDGPANDFSRQNDIVVSKHLDATCHLANWKNGWLLKSQLAMTPLIWHAQFDRATVFMNRRNHMLCFNNLTEHNTLPVRRQNDPKFTSKKQAGQTLKHYVVPILFG